jgi:ATP-dependent exoDNAse (exonuclease V) beta subunit
MIRTPSWPSAAVAAVHALLEWSQANDWAEPSAELAERHALAAGLGRGAEDPAGLLEPVRQWLRAPLRRERIEGAARVRAELPILLGVGGSVLRGSIDLLVEREGEPPLVVDYKTDRLGAEAPGERAARYGIQRAIYALAAAQALDAEEVEVAYVFLERPEEPAISHLDAAEMETWRQRLAATIAQISAGDFPVAPKQRRDWSLCRGCPALGRLCAGPEAG